MKTKILFIIFFALSTQIQAQDFITNIHGRKTTLLNGRWQAIIDQFSRGQAMKLFENKIAENKTEFYEYLFSDASRLDVPGDFNSQRPELKYYESSVWYKRDFSYNMEKGKRLFLYFGSANYRCKTYLNGKLLGTHEGGFTPFQFEITELIQEGNNYLIVEVNNARHEDAIPALVYDWWNYGGLTGDVFLVEMPSTYIDDYFIRLDNNNSKNIQVDIKLSGKNISGESVKISIPEINVKETLQTNSDGKASIYIPVKNLTCWSPENPKLYNVILTSEEDSVEELIGFRTIEVKGTDIFLNGKSVFLKGINCHDEIPMRRSRAYSEIDAAMLIREVKELGCNFLRLTHYPTTETMVRMAEKEGLILFEEIPQWQRINFKNEETNKLARQMMREMIRRDKNRCSIIAWSVANETHQSPERDSALISLVRMTRDVDNSRLVTAVTDKIIYNKEKASFSAQDALLEHLDFVCVNRYMGWYMPWPVSPDKIKWEVCPNKPLIISEFGGEALYGNSGPDDVASSWSEEYQEKLYVDNLVMFEKIKNLSGIAPWVLFDFRSPYRMNTKYQEEWNRKGLISENGFRKKAWYVMHEYYKKKRISK